MTTQWKPKILLVDDSPSHREILVDIFRNEHQLEIITATQGEEALALLERLDPEEYPDLVVTDVKMPVMSGVEMVERLAASSKFQDLSVIIYSGSIENLGLLPGVKTMAVVSIEEVETLVLKRIRALEVLKASREAVQQMKLSDE